jgi:hypothetical protein
MKDPLNSNSNWKNKIEKKHLLESSTMVHVGLINFGLCLFHPISFEVSSSFLMVVPHFFKVFGEEMHFE